MKCCYRLDDGPWIKGEIVSMSGGREVNLHSRLEDGTVANELTFANPEVLFCGRYMCITGYQAVESISSQRIYKLISVDVSGGWFVPKGK